MSPSAKELLWNDGWTDAARAASLAVRQAKSKLRSSVVMSGMSSGNDGVTVAFTDATVDPPIQRVMREGEEEDGWHIVSADYDAGTAVLVKDGIETVVSYESGLDESRVADAADSAESDYSEYIAEEDAFHMSPDEAAREAQQQVSDAMDDFADNGIWGMGENAREALAADLQNHLDSDGWEGLSEPAAQFLAEYDQYTQAEEFAGEIVQLGGEPSDLVAVSASHTDVMNNPDATDAERADSEIEYRAEVMAAQELWGAKAVASFTDKYGRPPETGDEAMEAEDLVGVPVEFSGTVAYAGQSTVALNRARVGQRIDELLANKGWTDEARAASLAARQKKAGQKPRAVPAGPKPKTKKSVEADRIAAEKYQRARARKNMFEQQRTMGGEDFINNWYPATMESDEPDTSDPELTDGRYQDPHYGVSTRAAPYGFVDGTDKPRSEPLYDASGRPIIPRPRGGHGDLQDDMEFVRQEEKALRVWGKFGTKRHWMAQHPESTEADWAKHDQERIEKWKGDHPR